MMMHRDHMAKRQEVCAGHIDNMLILCLHLRQHLKPKGWIIKCISGVVSYLKCTWIAENVFKFLYSREREKQVQENELPWWNLECAQKNGKTDINCCKDRISSVKNSIYFSRAMDADLALSITWQQPFGFWGESKLQTCVRLSASLHTSRPTWKRFPWWALGLEQASSSRWIYQCRAYSCPLPWKTQVGYKGDNPANLL